MLKRLFYMFIFVFLNQASFLLAESLSPSSESIGNPLPLVYEDLVPYVSPSPFQEDANSCLFMALTGVVEFWIRKNVDEDFQVNDDYDLSERYFMSQIGPEVNNLPIENWKTDLIYLFNDLQAVRNRDIPFAKGWYKMVDNRPTAAREGDSNAQYGALFNWTALDNQRDDAEFVSMPTFNRQVLFQDVTHLSVGGAPENIVDQVKMALYENQAPVMVIYNHYGFWHASLVVGYDDQWTSNCQFSHGLVNRFEADQLKLSQELDRIPESDYYHRMLLEGDLNRLNYQIKKLKESQKPCRRKGAFLVRDSLNQDSSGPLYDYDPLRQGEERFMSHRTIYREYEWLEMMSNHVIQILVDDT